MSCPYCMRDEGHYLGCKALEQQSIVRQNLVNLAWAVGGVMAVGALLWAVAFIFGGGG